MAIRQRDSGPPSPGQIDIWYRLTEPLVEPDVMVARALLSREERTRCDQYRFACDRRDYAVSHALLRTSLSRYCDVDPRMWTFDMGVHGKPRLTTSAGSAGALTFNLSHAHGIVACAIAADTEVGIDVVRTNTAFDYSSVAAKYFSTHEIVQLDSCVQEDRATRFMELWALKEAYTKATGQGLTASLSDFGFIIDSSGIRFLPPCGVSPHAWQFALFELGPHYRIAAAAEQRDIPISTIQARSADIGFTAADASNQTMSSTWKS